jgi:long-chain acyl-CoA synthetase
MAVNENIYGTVLKNSAFLCDSERRGPIHRSVDPELQGRTSLNGCNTLYETFQRSISLHPNQPCLGERLIDSNGNAGPYIFKSYSECGM